MAETRVNWCLKYFIFFINFFFWVMSCLMVGVGVWAYLHKNQFKFDAENKGAFDFLFDAAVIMIVIGLFIFLLSFTGCVGALRENLCMIKTFYISLIIVFLLELAAIVFVFVTSSSSRAVVVRVMKEEALTRYWDDPDLMNMIDFFQKEFSCCGIGPEGYKDWNHNLYFRCQRNSTVAQKCSVPFSCCIDPVIPETQRLNTMCGYGMLAKSTYEASQQIYTTGCVDAIIGAATGNLYLLAGIAITIAVAQLVTIFLARSLEDQIKDQMTTVAYRY